MTSNLFGSFGAGLFTGPNLIDFGTVFDDFGAKLLENIHVFAAMIIVVIAYIPLAVLSRRFDKKDKFKACELFSLLFGICNAPGIFSGSACHCLTIAMRMNSSMKSMSSPDLIKMPKLNPEFS